MLIGACPVWGVKEVESLHVCAYMCVYARMCVRICVSKRARVSACVRARARVQRMGVRRRVRSKYFPRYLNLRSVHIQSPYPMHEFRQHLHQATNQTG